MNKLPAWAWVLFLGLVGVLAASWASIYVVDLLSDGKGDDELARLGTVGDMFGAVGALFAGLGFVGVAAALVSDVSERRADREGALLSRIPYLVPSVEKGGVKLFKAYFEQESLAFGISGSVKVTNIASEPALNISAVCKVVDYPNLQPDCIIDSFPVSAGKESVLAIQITAEKTPALQLLTTLSKNDAVACEIEVSYMSLAGKPWISRVRYDFKAAASQESKLVAILRREKDSEVFPPGSRDVGVGAIALDASPVRGSFACEPAMKPRPRTEV